MRADAIAVNRCLPGYQISQLIFINTAAGKNRSVMQTAPVKYLPDFFSMICQIAAIKPNSLDFYTLSMQASRQIDYFPRCIFSIVSINQKHNIIRISLGKMNKGLAFLAMRLHKRMRHGPIQWEYQKPYRQPPLPNR